MTIRETLEKALYDSQTMYCDKGPRDFIELPEYAFNFIICHTQDPEIKKLSAFLAGIRAYHYNSFIRGEDGVDPNFPDVLPLDCQVFYEGAKAYKKLLKKLEEKHPDILDSDI